MQLTFKTRSTEVAERAALALLIPRQQSHSPLTNDDARLWVAERFPFLSHDDHEQLVAFVKSHI